MKVLDDFAASIIARASDEANHWATTTLEQNKIIELAQAGYLSLQFEGSCIRRAHVEPTKLGRIALQCWKLVKGVGGGGGESNQ